MVAEHRPQAVSLCTGDELFAIGSGTNIIWVDPDHDIVAVVRWIEGQHIDNFMKLVLDSIKAGTQN